MAVSVQAQLQARDVEFGADVGQAALAQGLAGGGAVGAGRLQLGRAGQLAHAVGHAFGKGGVAQGTRAALGLRWAWPSRR